MLSPSTIRDVISSLNSNDSDKVAACFAPDAKIITLSSRSRPSKASGDPTIRLAAEPSIRNVTEDVAIVECDFESSGASGTPEKGRSVSVVKKVGGEWRIDYTLMMIADPGSS
jgi:hypothetical protein